MAPFTMFFRISALTLILISTPAFPRMFQSTIQANPAPGKSSVARVGDEFQFSYDSKLLYRYSSSSGATLNGLRAVTESGSEFWPSFGGGLTLKVGKETIQPTDPRIRYKRIAATMDKDTIIASWQLQSGATVIDYRYSFFMRGRTLVIRVEELNGATAASGFVLDRSLTVNPSAPRARALVVPSLPLCYVLLSNDVFTSLYFDWESTQASSISPYPQEEYKENSVNYSQYAEYLPRTDGKRNILRETIFLTVSPDLDDVLPPLTGPVSPEKRKAADRIVLSYFSPFPWLLRGVPHDIDPRRTQYLDSLRHLGIGNLAVIVKNWNNGQFDNRYPVYFPVTSWTEWEDRPRGWRPPGGGGGQNNLLRLRNKIVHDPSDPYDFALHENYVDFYQNTKHKWGWNQQRASLNCDGSLLRGFHHPRLGAIPVMKPSWVNDFARYWSGRIASTFHPTWGYLDVQSALPPSERVDFDASSANKRTRDAGKMLATLQAYRTTPAVLRSLYHGPVTGEGMYACLYAGYFDDFDGTILTADPRVNGIRAPLLVDFDLKEIHPRSTEHGVGHYDVFFSPIPESARQRDTSRLMLQQYLATELAFGHGGLISKGNLFDQTIRQAVIEYRLLFPVERAYMNAVPVSIEYSDGKRFFSASEYIRSYPGYADAANNKEFMSRVRVVYDNGVEVLVNRSSQPWRVTAGQTGGWFTWNIQGMLEPDAGTRQENAFTLKAECGWVCYVPNNVLKH
jgi:hypothetical protein